LFKKSTIPPTREHTWYAIDGFLLGKKNKTKKTSAVGGFSEKELCSWWIIGTSTLQNVDFSNKHFVVVGLSFGGGEQLINTESGDATFKASSFFVVKTSIIL